MADDARNILRDILSFFGLDDQELLDATWGAIGAGRLSANSTIDEIGIAIRGTEAYKRRFAGNEIRRQQGLPQLTVSEYLRLEGSYSQVLRSRSMPPGFYDDPATDFSRFIAGDVSPDELAGRVDDGFRAVSEADPEVRRQFRELYGVAESELAAYFIDPDRMRPTFNRYEAQRQAQAAQIASQAQRQAEVALTREQAELLARQGVSPARAQEGFGAMFEARSLLQAQQAGEQAIGQDEAIGAFLGQNAAAAQRVATRARRRRAEAEAGGGFAQTNQFLQTGLQTVGQ